MSTEGLVLVTGGTGGLGHRVVARLRSAGRDVRVLSRQRREPTAGVEHVVGNLETNEGVAAAVAGAETVVHCAATGKVKPDALQAHNLTRAAKQAAVRHLVCISVVGAERIPVKSAVDRSMFAYFASQRAKEQVIEESGLPWTNLRATQFHDGFILAMVRAMSKLPIVLLPSETRFQPIDTDEVAAALVDLAAGRPAGQVPDVAGPKIYDSDYLLRTYLQVIGKHRPIAHMKVPGAAAAAIRAGANLTPDRAVGTRTWEDFLTGLTPQVDKTSARKGA